LPEKKEKSVDTMICFSGVSQKVGRKVGVKVAAFLTGLPPVHSRSRRYVGR